MMCRLRPAPTPRVFSGSRLRLAACGAIWAALWVACHAAAQGPSPAAPQVEPSAAADEAPPGNDARREESLFADEPAERSPQPLLTGELPWSESVQATRKLPNQRLRSARQMLEMLGVDDSQWRRLEDGQPPQEADFELIYKILFRMPRFLLEDIERWQHHSPDWAQVAANAGDLRGEMYLMKGTATRVERIELIPELAELYEFDRFYRVTVEHAAGRGRSTVFTRRIPQAWPLDEEMSQRVHVSAMLIKAGPSDGDAVSLVMAAPRIAWFPEHASAELQVSEDRQLLASLGMDLGLFDDVRQRTDIGSHDREAFYQMLAAVRHSTPDQLTTDMSAVSELGPLFQSPEKEIGELKTFVGTARRITKVECDEDIRRRLGLPHYYQVDVFIPLDNEQIRLGRKEETPPGEEGPVFTSSFPFTLCVAKLPPGVEPEQEMNEQIRFTAFFFKLWTYKTVYMDQFGDEKKQIGPMLIGKQFAVVEPPASPLRPYLGAIFGVLFVAALVGVWVSLWRNAKSDEAFHRSTLRKSYEVPEGKSLDEMGLEESGGPDFSNWEERGES